MLHRARLKLLFGFSFFSAGLSGLGQMPMALAETASPVMQAGTIAPIAQTTPTASEVAAACAANRADQLPNPYTDVPADHWAYRAVLTLYYCEPVRIAPQPTPVKNSSS